MSPQTSPPESQGRTQASGLLFPSSTQGLAKQGCLILHFLCQHKLLSSLHCFWELFLFPFTLQRNRAAGDLCCLPGWGRATGNHRCWPMWDPAWPQSSCWRGLGLMQEMVHGCFLCTIPGPQVRSLLLHHNGGLDRGQHQPLPPCPGLCPGPAQSPLPFLHGHSWFNKPQLIPPMPQHSPVLALRCWNRSLRQVAMVLLWCHWLFCTPRPAWDRTQNGHIRGTPLPTTTTGDGLLGTGHGAVVE